MIRTERCVLIVLLALALAAPTAAASDDAERALQLADAVASRYASLDAFSMDFIQTSYWSLADSTVQTSGTLLVRRPDRIAIEYGTGGRIVIRGDSLRAFAPESGQFFVAGVDTSSSVIDPARVLRAYRPDAEQPIRPARDDPRFGGPPPTGTLTLALRPADRLTDPSLLLVRIDPDALRVRSILAVARGGDWTRYDILREREVSDHEPGTFVLRRPPGAEIVSGMPFGGF